MTEKDRERFWSKASYANGCWEYPKDKHHRYGQFYANGKVYLAHRISWEITQGGIPYGREVCHSCDNGYCVNPSHLFLGTHKDNMQDASRKKRWPRVKITDGMLMHAKSLRLAGASFRAIGRAIGVSHGNIIKALRAEG